LAGAEPVDQLAPLDQSFGPVALIVVACVNVALPLVVTLVDTINGKPAVCPAN
jgi:hypothetical protein